MRYPIVVTLLAVAAIGAGAPAADVPVQPTPGVPFTVQFPEMPPTFHDIAQNTNVAAQATILLPANYDPARMHPLLIFLNGGDGMTGAELGVSRSLCEGKDFVCVSMPLFKDPKADSGYIMQDSDGKYMWPFFKTMLAKVEALVPNLDPARRVLGGFSNGAHATAALIDESGGEITRRFSAFLVVEGAGRLHRYDLLKGKRFLVVSSNSRSKRRAREIVEAAAAAGAMTTFIFEDVGKHDFPVGAYPAVREWLRGPAIQ